MKYGLEEDGIGSPSKADSLPGSLPNGVEETSDHTKLEEDLDDGMGLGIDGAIDTDDILADNATADDKETEDLRASDPACAWCDDGGEIMQCDGNCMRSFHIGLGDRESPQDPSICNPMGMPVELSERLLESHEMFECPNCVTHRHQCFSCKREGDSNPLAPADDSTLRRCAIYTCGKFYHPRCLKLPLSRQLITCPLHSCGKPKCKIENSSDHPLIPCRRCPIAYHEDCMPRDILKTCELEHGKRMWLAKFDEEGNSIADPVERSLIYCTKHKIAAGQDNPDHPKPLFSEKVLKAWRLHYAKMFPDLKWSLEIMKQEQEREQQRERDKEREKLADRKALTSLKRELQQGSQAEASEGGAVSRPDGDAVDAIGSVKRRRLVKRLDESQTPNGESQIEPIAAEDLPLSSVPSVTLTSKRDTELQVPEQEIKDVDSSDEDSFEENPDLFPFEHASYWKESNVKKVFEKSWSEIEKRLTFHNTWKETRKPEPYQMPSKKSVTEGRLQNFKIAFQMAKEDFANAHKYVDEKMIREMMQHEDNLRLVLAPFLFSTRYSSYGRHFTNTDNLQLVAKKLEPLAEPGDTIVDFSCGANEFVPLFKKHCLQRGKELKGVAFDILTPMDMTDFRKSSWFDVPVGSLGSPERLIIGVNPPYGRNNVLAEKFLHHAARFRPRLILLIVPPSTQTPPEYEIVLEDRTTMSDKSFYIPGLDKEDKQQWNKITPAFRILARKDVYPLRDHLTARHMNSPLWSVSFRKLNEIKRSRSMAVPLASVPSYGYTAY